MFSSDLTRARGTGGVDIIRNQEAAKYIKALEVLFLPIR